MQFLMCEMGLHLKTTAPTTAEVDLTDEETYMYMKRFQALDADGKGFITINDLRTHFRVRVPACINRHALSTSVLLHCVSKKRLNFETV